jgi:hypothetical protein
VTKNAAVLLPVGFNQRKNMAIDSIPSPTASKSGIEDNYNLDGTKYGAYLAMRAAFKSFIDDDPDDPDPYSQLKENLFNSIALISSGYATPK